MMAQPELTPDCAACAALCCVGLAIDKGEAFAIDKPAGTPCPNLRGHHCTIHEDLEKKGFSGCIAYSCTGAGQRTLQLFGGQSWRDDPELLGRQMETFRHLKTLHELIELLTAAAALPLPPDAASKREKFAQQLTPANLTIETAKTLSTGPIPQQIRSFLRSLRSCAPQT